MNFTEKKKDFLFFYFYVLFIFFTRKDYTSTVQMRNYCSLWHDQCYLDVPLARVHYLGWCNFIRSKGIVLLESVKLIQWPAPMRLYIAYITGAVERRLTLTLWGPSAGVSGSLDSYCSLKPLCSGMGEVVPARTSPTLPPPSPRTVLWLPCFKVSQCINCRDWHCKS